MNDKAYRERLKKRALIGEMRGRNNQKKHSDANTRSSEGADRESIAAASVAD